MRRTGPAFPTALALAGAVLAWLLEVGLAATGSAAFVPPYSLAVALLGVAAVVLVVGWPIRQAVRGKATRRLDPFRAMRVVVLAKASTLVGALLGGATLAVVVYLLSRPVLPPTDNLVSAITGVVAGVVLLVAGLVVEHWCRIPPEDDETEHERLDLRGE